MENKTLLIPENINLEQYQKTVESCLKGTYEFAGTTYHNICTGETFYILNGFWDFAGFITLFVLTIAFTFLILKAIID